jgi:hypothetical protein
MVRSSWSPWHGSGWSGTASRPSSSRWCHDTFGKKKLGKGRKKTAAQKLGFGTERRGSLYRREGSCTAAHRAAPGGDRRWTGVGVSLSTFQRGRRPEERRKNTKGYRASGRPARARIEKGGSRARPGPGGGMRPGGSSPLFFSCQHFFL